MTSKASKLFLVLALGASGALACKKSGGGGSVPVPLQGLGVTAQAPEGSPADKAIIGDGITITGPDLRATVEVAGKDHAKTLVEAKDKNALYSPTNWKEETLTDGWAVTFQNHGAMGTNYWVQARRTIGGKAYWCEANVNDEASSAAGLAVCKSLK